MQKCKGWEDPGSGESTCTRNQRGRIVAEGVNLIKQRRSEDDNRAMLNRRRRSASVLGATGGPAAAGVLEPCGGGEGGGGVAELWEEEGLTAEAEGGVVNSGSGTGLRQRRRQRVIGRGRGRNEVNRGNKSSWGRGRFIVKPVGIIPGNVKGVTKGVVEGSKIGVEVPHVGRVGSVTRENLTRKHVQVGGRKFLRGAVWLAPPTQEERTLPSCL